MASYGLPFPLADQVFGTLQVPFGAVYRTGYFGRRFGVVLGTEIARPAVEATQPRTGLQVYGALPRRSERERRDSPPTPGTRAGGVRHCVRR